MDGDRTIYKAQNDKENEDKKKLNETANKQDASKKLLTEDGTLASFGFSDSYQNN
jgi:hypothetical protein